MKCVNCLSTKTRLASPRTLISLDFILLFDFFFFLFKFRNDHNFHSKCSTLITHALRKKTHTQQKLTCFYFKMNKFSFWYGKCKIMHIRMEFRLLVSVK